MGITVTSWFIDQLASLSVTAKRQFLIGTSDYTDRVTRFPKIPRTANELKAINPRVTVSNADGEFNGFINNPYTIQTSGDNTQAQLKFGFTHPTSGDELVTIYNGYLRGVNYKKEKVDFLLKDRLHRLEERVIGDDDNPVTFTAKIPTDIIYSICVSYAGLNSTQTSANPDIFWASFNSLSAIMSTDNITLSARFEGEKCSEALAEVAKHIDASIWTDYDGKLYMDRFSAVTDEETLIVDSNMLDIDVTVDVADLVNKQFVAGDYDVDSRGWFITVFNQSSVSVELYGLRENTLKSELVWYPTSVNAISLAERITASRGSAPKKFNIRTARLGFDRRVGETVRLVNSFFAITSADAWRVTGIDFDMKSGEIETKVDATYTFKPFILDGIDAGDAESVLDSTTRFLL